MPSSVTAVALVISKDLVENGKTTPKDLVENGKTALKDLVENGKWLIYIWLCREIFIPLHHSNFIGMKNQPDILFKRKIYGQMLQGLMCSYT